MQVLGLTSSGVAALLFCATSMFAVDLGDDAVPGDRDLARQDASTRDELIGQFLTTHPGTRLYETDTGDISLVYGNAFSHGDTARDSAEAFRPTVAGMWGLDPDDLIPVGRFEDGRHVQPIMYDRDTDTYKFTGFYYTQTVDGVPVFRGELILLVRNEATYPLVMATTCLHAVGDFQVNADATTLPERTLRQRAAELLGVGAEVSDIELVVYTDRENDEPTLATSFVASNAGPAGPYKYLYVVDQAGNVLFEENQILHVDVVGNVSGVATQNDGADVCEPEALEALPYIEANVVGGNSTFADAAGDFVIPHGGSSAVNVRARLRGQWFEVFDQGAGGSTPEIVLPVTPPGPVDFTFNQANSSELERAGVNAYLHSNVVRDFTLFYTPNYPTIANQQFFDVNVNINSNCNAFYDGSSINFYTSGGGCNNTAFAPVVYHEYGHHLVQVAGSGQGQYGEGMGDVMALLITGEPQLAIGFDTCAAGIRNADNTVQFPCSGGIHACGQLLSGCVWDTWQALGGPGTSGDDIIANLAINAMLVRGQMDPGNSTIGPEITIIFLELDDDNGNIGDGTPHYAEIATGFGLHNMDAPPLDLIAFEFPNGLPETVDHNGGTAVRVEVVEVAGTADPGTGMLHYDTGSGFTAIPMSVVSANVYDAVFPAAACGANVQYYFSAEAGALTETFPVDAPATSLQAVAATSLASVFEDDFEANQGWTVSGNAPDGQWQRAIPAGGGDRGDPPTDADGSSRCYVTDNEDGNSDVDDGSTILTSPIMDASQGMSIISYYRWYSNTFGNAPEADVFVVEISDNGGATWINLETVGPAGPEVDGGWFFKQFNLTDVPGFTPSTQFRIRFTASDLGDGSVVEAGVDAVTLNAVTCDDAEPCPADLSGDDVVGVDDLLIVLEEWGDDGGDVTGDGTTDVQDMLVLLGAWGPCP